MTDTMFTRTALIEAAEKAGVTTDQARTILEAAGVTVQPEKPGPGTWHIVKDGPQVGDAARVDEDGYLHVIGSNGKTLRDIHPDNTWPDLTPARVVPAAAPVTLTEEQVGELWGEESTPLGAWSVLVSRSRERITDTVNSALTQYAAPAESEPIADAAKLIDPDDVRVGDRVRVELKDGDEATFTVRAVSVTYLCSRENAYNLSSIRAVYLLHREEA